MCPMPPPSEHKVGSAMSRLRSSRVTLFVIALAAIAMMSGCSSSPPPISVSLAPSAPQAIDQSQTLAITAAVTNDRSNRGVVWTLTGPGSLSNQTESSVTYTSPTTNLSTAQQV